MTTPKPTLLKRLDGVKENFLKLNGDKEASTELYDYLSRLDTEEKVSLVEGALNIINVTKAPRPTPVGNAYVSMMIHLLSNGTRPTGSAFKTFLDNYVAANSGEATAKHYDSIITEAAASGSNYKSLSAAEKKDGHKGATAYLKQLAASEQKQLLESMYNQLDEESKKKININNINYAKTKTKSDSAKKSKATGKKDDDQKDEQKSAAKSTGKSNKKVSS